MKKNKAILIQPTKAYNFLFVEMIQKLLITNDYKIILLINEESQKANYLKLLRPSDIIININHDFKNETYIKTPDILNTAKNYENKYGLSYVRDIMSQDRYYSNLYLDHAPYYVASLIDKIDLMKVFKDINAYYNRIEVLCSNYKIEYAFIRPDSLYGAPFVAVLEKNNIFVTVPVPSRYKSMATWSYGGYRLGNFLEYKFKKLKYIDEDISNLNLSDTKYPSSNREKGKQIIFLSSLFKDILKQIIIRTIFFIQDIKSLKINKRTSFYKWLKQRINGYRVSKWFRKNSFLFKNKPEEEKYFLLLLSVQPEIGSHSCAREFWDMKTIAQQAALCVPNNYKLYIKEHLSGIGNRSFNFYKSLNKIPTVRMLAYNEEVDLLLDNASAVMTINGTAGIEASLLNKPVIIFTKRTWYEFLSNVIVVESLKDLHEIMKNSVNDSNIINKNIVKNDAIKLYQVLKNNSFNALNTPLFRGKDEKISDEEISKSMKVLLEMKQFYNDSSSN